MWRSLIGAAAIGTVLVLAGCTVEAGGVAAVGVDRQGNPVGYIKVCVPKSRIDGATLYIDVSNVDDPNLTVGRWEAPLPVTDHATWSLAADETWRATQPMGTLEPQLTYHL